MAAEKLSLVQTTELATQEANVFSEYVSVRANQSASTIQGVDVLKEKVKLDTKLFGENSSHVANDYKAMDKDFKDAGITPINPRLYAYPPEIYREAITAEYNAKDMDSTVRDKNIVVVPGKEYLNTYVDLFDKYVSSRSDNFPNTCAAVLESKAVLDKTLFGANSVNVADDYGAMGRDLEEAGKFKPAADAYLNSMKVYVERKDQIFSLITGLDAAQCLNKAGNYAQAEPLYRLGVDFYDKFEREHHKPGSIKQSSPRLRGELGHCLLKQGKLGEANLQLLQSFKDARQGFKEIIPESCIPVLKDLAELRSIQNKPEEADKYAKLLKETEKRYQH